MSIIASGNIIPVLKIYQRKLGADYVVGSRSKMTGNRIDSISEADYSGLDFKVHDSRTILNELGIAADSVVAIGDLPADKGLFEFAGTGRRIAINPRNGIGQFADYVIHDDLAVASPILKELMGLTT